MADGLTANGRGRTEGPSQALLIELAADVVSAYVSKNALSATELPGLIRDIHQTLARLSDDAPQIAPRQESRPAVSVKKSVTDEYIVCLEDGKRFKSLKRHLRAKYGMSPEEYREKWGLPADYPMVAPSYARERSRLAKEMQLGRTK